jgi:hypothetical protein
MKLSSPWVEFYREIEALFAEDDEVKVVYDEENNEVKLYVENARKADALTQLLPAEKTFGNVTLKVTVIPANDAKVSKADLIAEAFEGNPALSYVQHVGAVIGEFDYAVFKNKVVQFFDDNLSDINGNKSTLYENIAKDVFGENVGVFFCTEAPVSLTKPLGEWP